MLLRYIVSNYKSIGHPLEFSMLPTSTDIDEKYIMTIQTRVGKWKVLRRGCFFGPNASGKSSFVESLAFVKKMVVDGVRSGKVSQLNQFRGDIKDLNGLSSFQLVFFTGGDVYEYGFSMNRVLVSEEWLLKLSAPTGKFVPAFTRTTNNQRKTTIEIGSALARNGSKARNLAELLKTTIKEEQCGQLFLFKLYDNGMKKVEPVIQWFERLTPIFPTSKINGLPLLVKSDDVFRQNLQQELIRMDTGVVSLETKDDIIDLYEYADKEGLPAEVIKDIASLEKGVVQINGKFFILTGNKKNTDHEAILRHCVFTHELNGKKVPFEINDESDGTQRLTDLLPLLFNDALGGEGAIYIVDEIDRSLHTKLTVDFLAAFLSTEKMSQLIFTVHDVNIINLDYFSQDEIWFIEKNKNGESGIRPLSDFQVKKSQDTIKAYLNGRFGAVPQIGRRDDAFNSNKNSF